MKSSTKVLVVCLLVGLLASHNCKGAAVTDPIANPNGTNGDTTKLPVTTPEPSTNKPTDNPTTTATSVTPDKNTTTTAPITTTSSTTTDAPKTTSTSTTTEVPTTTTLPTTTAEPNSTTTSTTPATTTTTPGTSSTTDKSTTTIAPSTTTTEAPQPPPCKRFDGPSFIGGIVLTLGLLAIGLVAYKFYKARNDRNYHSL